MGCCEFRDSGLVDAPKHKRDSLLLSPDKKASFSMKRVSFEVNPISFTNIQVQESKTNPYYYPSEAEVLY